MKENWQARSRSSLAVHVASVLRSLSAWLRTERASCNLLQRRVPLDRYGHVDEVAALVAFVAGPESSYINGANLTADGGTNA